MQDIKLFLETRTQNLMKPENKDTIVETLVEKSEGLMLYAYFVVSFIEGNVSVLDQGNLKGSLPLAISSVYHSYFIRLENELMKDHGVKEENFLNLLCAVTASREPLPLGFVSKVLVPSANSLVARRKVLKAIGSVSSLLPIRDGCLHVTHKSVKDWLTDKSSCYGEHDFTVDENEGHHILANLCSDALDNLKEKGVHDTQLSPTEKYALQHGFRHMLQLYKNTRPGRCSLEECVQRYLIDVELLYAKLFLSDSLAAEDILWLQSEKISRVLSEESRGVLNSLKLLLRKHFITFSNHPQVFLQTVLNEGGTLLSPMASNLLHNNYPEIPYLEFVHKQLKQGAVLARFPCSPTVACFDISPESDYMVCECTDGKIQLWSLHTGKLVWERLVKKPYSIGSFRRSPSSPVVSFYRSVVFHPTADVVLPGVLSHAYTFDGDLKPHFPESHCNFTVCSISGDKTKMLTDCPDDAKCIIMWSLKNGSEITRTTRNLDVLSFAWSRDGTLLAFSHSTGSISIVDAMDGFRILAETVIPEICGMIKFSPDCRSLFCMRNRRNIFRLNINMAEFPICALYDCKSYVPWEFESHSQAGFLLGDLISSSGLAFDFVLNKQTVLRGAPHHSFIELLNIGELCEAEREATLTVISYIEFSLRGEIVYVVGDGDNPKVSAWDVSSRELIEARNIRLTGYNRCLIDNGNLLIALKEGVLLATASGALELWNFDLSKCVRSWTNVCRITRMIRISEERVACEVGNEVIILDTTSGEIVSTVPNSRGYLLACNSKCHVLTYQFKSLQLSDGQTTFWRKGVFVSSLFGRRPTGIFSLSERFVVICPETIMSRHCMYVLDALSGKTVHTVREVNWVFDCKFISDEECVISLETASEDNCLQLFNVESGDLLSVINLENEVNCLAACPRKRLLAIEQSGSKHGFKLIQVHLPQDKDNGSIRR